MTTPLYQGHDSDSLKKKPDNAHAGLWFERFFNGYQHNGQDWQIPKPDGKKDAKRDWINSVAGSVGDQALKDYANRQSQLLCELTGRSLRYTTDWHFVTGMGNPHPVENGFAWHPTLGVPYLAGSVVKGLLRAWVELNEDALQPDEHKARLKSWFGTESKDEVAEQAGGFIFFDAIPDQPPCLLCDIMTPHMGQWYSEGQKGDINNPAAIPADWHEPLPVSFLAVKQMGLIFSIAPRLPQMAEQLDEVFAALTNALVWLGAGAKTAAGYGYMSLDDEFSKEQAEAARQQAEKQRLAALSPERQKIEHLKQQLQNKQQSKSKEKMGGVLYVALKELVVQAKDWPPAEKADLLKIAEDLLVFIEAKNNKTAKTLLNELR